MADQSDGAQGKAAEPMFRHGSGLMFEEDLQELMKKVEGVNDERLLAIVTALIFEDRIDTLLRKFLPRYAKLAEAEGCTFSLKIRVLESLQFVPSDIITTLDCFRQIRNEFAHNLTKTTFEELPDKYKSRLNTLVRSQYYSRPEPVPGSLRGLFDRLRIHCIHQLQMFATNIEYLRKAIESPGFTDIIATLVADRNLADQETLMAKTPISVEQHGNVTIKRYEGGIVWVEGGRPEPETNVREKNKEHLREAVLRWLGHLGDRGSWR